MRTLYLIAHALPLELDPQPAPVVVASITEDPMFTRNTDTRMLLKVIAGRLGLLEFEIVSSEAQEIPGFQQELPFPSAARKKGASWRTS